MVAYLSQLGYLLDFFTVCFGIFVVEVLDVLQQNAKNTNQGKWKIQMKNWAMHFQKQYLEIFDLSRPILVGYYQKALKWEVNKQDFLLSLSR